MSLKFRPQVQVLEGREVPAAFSFVLPDGTIGSGRFEAPAGVDPAQASQSFAVPDLTLTYAGQVYTVEPGAEAQYANGVLVGVSATASEPGALTLANGQATLDGMTAALALDAADTQATFTLPDGTVGAISYAIPWDQIDATQASQSLTPVAFNINIAGQNIAFGAAAFTTAPTLQFANGNQQGLTFAVSLAGLGLPYSGLSVAGWVGTATDAVTGQLLTVPVAAVRQTITLEFYLPTTEPISGTFVLKMYDRAGNVIESIPIGFTDKAKAEDVAQAVVAALDGHKTFKATRDGAKVTISAPSATDDTQWAKLTYTGPKLAKPTPLTTTGSGVAFVVTP